MFMQNIIKLSAAVHELSLFMCHCANKLFCPISQWWRIRKSGPV